MDSSNQQRPSDEVATEVQSWRRRRKWSYRRLAQELEKIGAPITEDVLVNILTRRPHETRGKSLPARAISVDELAAFARVFDTSVLHLIPRSDPATHSFELHFTSDAAFTYFMAHYASLCADMERRANQEGTHNGGR
jgi:hypothetical protein